MRGRPTQDSRFTRKLVIGILCMALGGVFLLHNLNIADVHQTLRFWPMALVLLGLERILSRGFLRATGGHVLILLGLALQLDALEKIYLLEKWWPLGIVWIGLVFTLRAVWSQIRPAAPSTQTGDPFCQDSNERQS